MIVMAGVAGVAFLLFVLVVVLVALVRDPDPVEPAPVESGRPRDAVRSVMDRRER